MPYMHAHACRQLHCVALNVASKPSLPAAGAGCDLPSTAWLAFASASMLPLVLRRCCAAADTATASKPCCHCFWLLVLAVLLVPCTHIDQVGKGALKASA